MLDGTTIVTTQQDFQRFQLQRQQEELEECNDEEQD